MAALTITKTAAKLGISVPTLRRALRAGAPQARPGRRGRGGRALLNPEAVAAWRARQRSGMPYDENLPKRARAIAVGIGDALWMWWSRMPRPDKIKRAGTIAAAGYVATTAVYDVMREAGIELPEPSPPDSLQAMMQYQMDHRGGD